ncbi:unnamed protein product [Hymenolepis diminuta]|nr:unnamed protein product [Hymenolepis diminuta]
MSKLTLYQIADVTRESGNHFLKIEMKDGQDLILIGRWDDKHLIDRQISSSIVGKAISRLHAFIERTNDEFYLSDLSKSGTYINHRRVDKRTQLKPHDLVFFGHPKGGEIRPGEPIGQYFWDLKYVVMIESSEVKSDQETEFWKVLSECFEVIHGPRYMQQ